MGHDYDRDYFRKWYRDPEHRIRSRAELRRKAGMVLGMAEHVLGRPARSVLDVGCGEGEWAVVLRALRPRIRYEGIDRSEYAVERFGRQRNIRLGTIADLPSRPVDLIVCSDVLHYISAEEMREPLRQMALLTNSIAFLEVMTREDAPIGDLAGWHERPAAWYLKTFAAAGFTPCGMQCYLGDAAQEAAAELDVFGR
jgi:SAM-dependent methyltransferase